MRREHLREQIGGVDRAEFAERLQRLQPIGRVRFGDCRTQQLEDAVAGTKIETALSVVPPSLETARTWQDAELLKEIASASQGSYYTVASARDLVEKIPDKRQTITVQGKPQPLWDTGFMLLLVASLLIVEWALRKRYKLL